MGRAYFRDKGISSARIVNAHLPLTVPYRSERLGPANRGAFRRHFRPGNRTLRNVPNGIANLYSQFPGNVKLRCRLPGKAGICRLHLMNSRSTRWTEEFQMVGADGVEWPRRRVCTPSKFLPPSQRRFCAGFWPIKFVACHGAGGCQPPTSRSPLPANAQSPTAHGRRVLLVNSREPLETLLFPRRWCHLPRAQAATRLSPAP